MKLIDEKGKLFGKINLIDLLALIIVVAAVVFLAVRFLSPSDSGLGANAVKLTYTAQVQAVDEATYREVQRFLDEAPDHRDQLMANGELLPAYVTGVTAVPHVSYNPDSTGHMVRFEEADRLDLTFTVEAMVDDPIVNKVGTQEVRVAKSHILKTTHFEFPYSTIMTCDWE